MKTITLNRYPIFGRSGFMVHALHGGTTIHQHLHCQKLGTMETLLAFARREGFTHARFIGDWSGVTTRNIMQLYRGAQK